MLTGSTEFWKAITSTVPQDIVTRFFQKFYITFIINSLSNRINKQTGKTFTLNKI